MPEYAWIVAPALAGLASFVGAMVGNRTDIKWLRDAVKENRRAIGHAHRRIDNLTTRKID